MNAPTHAGPRSAGRHAQLNPFELEVVESGEQPETGPGYGCVDWYLYPDGDGRKFPAPRGDLLTAHERSQRRIPPQ